MLETSNDVLNIVLAFSVLLVALFLSYFLFGLIRIIQDIRNISKLTKEKLELLDRLLNTIKEKLEHSATYFGILVKLVEKFVNAQRNKNSSTASSEDKDNNIKIH